MSLKTLLILCAFFIAGISNGQTNKTSVEQVLTAALGEKLVQDLYKDQPSYQPITVFTNNTFTSSSTLKVNDQIFQFFDSNHAVKNELGIPFIEFETFSIKNGRKALLVFNYNSKKTKIKLHKNEEGWQAYSTLIRGNGTFVFDVEF